MTRHFARKAHTLNVATLFVAVFTILTALASLAQVRDANQPSATSQAGMPSQALVQLPPSATAHQQGVSPRRQGKKKAHSTAPGALSLSFQPAVTYDTGQQGPTSVTVADFNGDGRLDVVTANSQSTVGVLFGNSDGTLQSATTYPAGFEQSSIAVADFNGDGKLDVVTSGESSSVPFAASVLLGNGAGGFEPVAEYSSGGDDDNSVAAADLNGDGNPDIVVANWYGVNGRDAAIGVLLGNGDGTFKPTVSYDPGGVIANAVAIADVNRDGKLDVLVAETGCNSCSTSGIAVLLGNGDGTFQSAKTFGTGGSGGAEGFFAGESLAVADVNGDGKPDVAVVNSESNTVAVLLGNGDGTFQSAVTYGTGGSYPDAVAISDLNGDGNPDLVVVNQSEGTLAVLLGNGDGTFQAAVTFSTGGSSPNWVFVADLNGDGSPDLVVANESGTVGVLLNNSVPSTPTTTTLVSSLNPSNFGQTVTFTASVSSTSGTPTGTVIFYDGSTAIGSAALASGSTSLSTSSLSAGSHSITAAYQGSGSFAPSTSVVLTQVVNGATTTTALTSSLNPSVFGQSVTFTAGVSSSAGTPTGTVIFYDGSNALGSATLAGGSAAITVSSLTAGSQSIIAAYQGSGAFLASTSAPLNQVVNTATTTTSLVASKNPARIKESVTYTATVTSQFGGAASGTVTFEDGGATIATVGLSGNQAAYSTSYAAAGVHSITATYSGDGNNGGSMSSVLTEKIGEGLFASKTVLATSGTPSFVGQPVTFTATVTSKDGTIPDGEQVTFYDDDKTIGTGTTAGGVAGFTTSSLTPKKHTIKATYAGDATFKKSSDTVTQGVDKYATMTTLVSSLNPAVYGQPVTYTATVTSSGPNPPTGSVRLTGIGLVPLVGGVASYTKTKIRVGTHAITAEYLGDSDSAPSTSTVLEEVVNPASTTTALTSSANPSLSGQNVTFTATVTSSTGLDPFGSVTFTAGSTTLGTVALKDTIASISTAALPVGSTTITATYSGADGFTGSSASLTQVVQP